MGLIFLPDRISMLSLCFAALMLAGLPSNALLLFLLFFSIALQEMTGLCPGAHDALGGDFSARAVAQRAAGPGWTRELMTATDARTPRFLYREAWSHKQFLVRQEELNDTF